MFLLLLIDLCNTIIILLFGCFYKVTTQCCKSSLCLNVSITSYHSLTIIKSSVPTISYSLPGIKGKNNLILKSSVIYLVVAWWSISTPRKVLQEDLGFENCFDYIIKFFLTNKENFLKHHY